MRIILYQHGGSDNRGCEAIVRSTTEILSNFYSDRIIVFSAHPEEDNEVGLEQIVDIQKNPICSIPEIPFFFRSFASIWNRLTGSEFFYFNRISRPFIKYDFNGEIAIHIGGDHYCYCGSKMLALHNRKVKRDGGISVLWGCSVEPSLLLPSVVEDMQTYDWITARESITYQALKNKGIEHVSLIPDPAFALPIVETDFSKNMNANTVGINISPYAQGEGGIGEENYREMIRWIQQNTNMDILLIPHVFKAHSNDPAALRRLYDSLGDKSRVNLITEKFGCRELKGIISKCRFYVGARTHSTIAAYSTCVPTLVLGYSVKAKGIAKDIFGTWENYVVPVQELHTQMELAQNFQWFYEHENEIRKHLNSMMPKYRQQTLLGAEVIQKIVDMK